MTHIKIHLMSIQHYNDVHALWLSTEGMGLNDIDDSYEGILRFLNRNPDTCFVAVHHNQIVGVILAGHDGRRGYIYHLAVAQTYRCQGVGGQLVDAAMTALAAQKISKVALVVFEHNDNANKFWEKQGFCERTDLIYRNKAIVKMTRIDT